MPKVALVGEEAFVLSSIPLRQRFCWLGKSMEFVIFSSSNLPFLSSTLLIFRDHKQGQWHKVAIEVHGKSYIVMEGQIYVQYKIYKLR